MIGTFLVGVSIILEKNGKVLLGRRSSGRYAAGLWEFPAGRLDVDEGPLDALIREAREELGIKVIPIQLVNSYRIKRDGKDLILLNYYCKYKGKIIKSEEHSKLKWFDFEDARVKLRYLNQKNTLDHFIKIGIAKNFK